MKMFVGILVSLALISGLAQGAKKPSPPNVNSPTYSPPGFLSNYPDFKEDPAGSNTYVYFKPGVDIATFDKIMIEPVLMWYSDRSPYKGFSPDQMKQITDRVASVMMDILSERFEIVNHPGPGVLTLRIALTEVYAQKRRKGGILSYSPMGIVSNAALSVADLNVDVLTIVGQSELLDSETREQLGAFINRKAGDEKGRGKQKKVSWDYFEELIAERSTLIMERLDKWPAPGPHLK